MKFEKSSSAKASPRVMHPAMPVLVRKTGKVRNDQARPQADLQAHTSGSYRNAGFYLAGIRRRKWCLLLVLVICVSVAAARSFTRQVHHRATATVLLTDEGDKQYYAPSRVGDPRLKYYDAYVFHRTRTLAQIMQSAPVRQAVAAYVERHLSQTSSADHATANSPGTGRGTLMGRGIIPSLSVTEARGTSLLNLSTVSMDPETAQYSLEGYLGVLSDYYMQRKHGDALKTATWLKEELDRTGTEMSKSRMAVQEFKMQHGILSADEHGGLINRVVSGWFDDPGAEQESENHTYGTAESERLDSNRVARGEADSTQVAVARQKLLGLEMEYTKLEQVYSPAYPKLVTLKRKIHAYENVVSDADPLGGLAARYRLEKTRFRESIKRARAEAVKLTSLGPEFHQLAMEAESNRQSYELILSEYKKAEKRTESSSIDVVVTQPPVTVAIGPDHVKRLGQAAVVGLLGGLLLAVILAEFDTRILSAEDVEKCLPCPVLGTVPDLSLFHRCSSSGPEGGAPAYEFRAYEDPRSPIYEAARNVHSSIFLSGFGQQTRCIAVSSSLPGEGKTLTGVSLASILSLDLNKNVLIVDADLRRPRIHKVFGQAQAGLGLTTLVERGSRDWTGIVRPTRLPRLFYLSSGPVPKDPVGVLRSDAMRDLMAALRASFDYVVLDTPPALGFPDAILVARLADGAILVAEEGVVRREEIREAYGAISGVVGTRVLGIILNKSRPSARWNKYYRGYAYGYAKYGAS